MTLVSEENQINNKLIRVTVGRISDALNRRFEKDASLYISNQQLLTIKELLSRNDFAKVFGLFATKEHSAEILAKAILNNAWLITKITQSEISRYIRPIFKVVNTSIVLPVVKDVIENKIQVPFELKDYLLQYYYMHAPLEECEDVLEDLEESKLIVFKTCLVRVIREETSISRAYLKLHHYMDDDRLQNDRMLVARALNYKELDEDDKEYIIEKIYEDYIYDAIMEDEQIDICWVGALTQLGRVALEFVISELEDSGRNDKRKKVLTSGLILPVILSQPDITEEDLDTLIELYESNMEVRYNLNYTLSKIQKEAIRDYLYEGFSAVNPSLERPTPMNGGELTEEELEKLIDDEHSVRGIVTRLRSHKTRNQTKLIKHLLNTYEIEEIEELLMMYFDRLRGNDKDLISQVILKYFIENEDELTEDLCDSLLNSIERNSIQSIVAREFMQTHDFNRFKRVFGN